MTGMFPKRKRRSGMYEYGRTALYYAVADGDVSAIGRLLKAGLASNQADDNTRTPLHFAARAQSAEGVRFLIEAGAIPDLQDTHGNTPLFRATFWARGSSESIKRLRDAGADPRKENLHGISPLGLAWFIGNFDVARFYSDLD